MLAILIELRRALRKHGRVILVVGSSRYAGVYIDTARIIQQLAVDAGFSLLSADNIRAMRSSAQHGGSHELAETRLILERR